MSTVKSKYERTYHILETLDNLVVAGETRTHIIYFCPCCTTKRGKPDEKGKFYWSDTKLTGYCFLCNTVFLPESDLEQSDIKLNSVINKLIDDPGNKVFERPPSLRYNFLDLDNKVENYLRNRNKYLPQLSEYLGITRWEGESTGVVIPFLYYDYVARYQVRFINPADPKRKYYISPGDHKLLYSPTHLFMDYKLNGPIITLCEGIFDAIALMIMGYPNPVATLGSTVTDYQIYQLRKLAPEEVIIVMDETQISRDLMYRLKPYLPLVSEYYPLAFENGRDPEEELAILCTNPENDLIYQANLSKLLGKLYEDQSGLPAS